MKSLTGILQKEIVPVSLILLLAFSRFVPHPPNFTPIVAVAIMSGYFFKNIKLSFVVLLIAMLLVDVFIGFYKHMLFVYLSLFLIAFVFFKISDKINFKNLFVFGFLGSLLFYLVSNFGVWVSLAYAVRKYLKDGRRTKTLRQEISPSCAVWRVKQRAIRRAWLISLRERFVWAKG